MSSPVANLSADEYQVLSSHLSRDSAIRQDQIDFLNGGDTSKIKYRPDNTLINRSIKSAEKRLSQSDIASTIYDLGKIDSLSQITAKTTIGATKFLDKQIDSLGSTILNAVDGLMDFASQSVSQMEDTLQTWAKDVGDAEKNFLNKNVYPISSVGTDFLKSISKDFATDMHTFNSAVSKCRILNTPGDVFNSVRHIAFAIKGEIEKLIDFTHQIFAGITAALIKLKRLMKRAVKAITVFMVTIIENIIPTQIISEIAEALNNVVGALGESLSTFLNTAGLNAQEGMFDGLQKEIAAFAKHPLLYTFEQIGVEPFVNLPILNWIKELEKAENQFINNQFFTAMNKFSEKYTLEYLISKLPKGMQTTIAVLGQLSSNPHGFIGNGMRTWARKHILKDKKGLFLGNLKSVGVMFHLSVPYHYSGANSNRTAPFLTFKPLLTDGTTSVTTDGYGNKVVTGYSTTRLF